jgi:hypothetical protein
MKIYPTSVDPLDRGIYDREVLVERADGRTWSLKWRWLPLIRWRYLSRAWQGYPPAGYVLASDWTGRERELIGWSWPACVRPVRLVRVVDYEPPLYRIGLDGLKHPIARELRIEPYDTAAREDHKSWSGNKRISA